MSEITQQQLMKMALHEQITVPQSNPKLDIIRVPGGWLYRNDIPGYNLATSTFVPEPSLDIQINSLGRVEPIYARGIE